MPKPQIFVFIWIIIHQMSGLCTGDRNIDFSSNPNCVNIDCTKPWIIYGKGENENNTMHYLWSAMNVPSFTMVLSDPDSEIEIDWPNLTGEGSIIFTKGWKNIFGISFQNLILFNDVEDTGTMQNVTEDQKVVYSLSEFDWKSESKSENDSSEYIVEFSTVSFQNVPLGDSKMSISISASEIDGRFSSLPHLITTQDSSHFEVYLDSLAVNSFDMKNFTNPRWALDIIILANDSAPTIEQRHLTYNFEQSLDDEHAPGVFQLDSISMQSSEHAIPAVYSGGYLQWRPVAYLTPGRSINSATYPNINNSLPFQLDEEHYNQAKKSLMYSLVGDNVKNWSTQTTIAFGLTGDGFYSAENYTVWSFSMGLGNLPHETFSSTLIIVIAVGVGFPLVLLVVVSIYLGFKKYQRRQGERLLDD